MIFKNIIYYYTLFLRQVHFFLYLHLQVVIHRILLLFEQENVKDIKVFKECLKNVKIKTSRLWYLKYFDF